MNFRSKERFGQEKSLNDPIKSGEADEWQDWLVDDSLDQELIISQKQEYDDKKDLLNSAMKILNDSYKPFKEESYGPWNHKLKCNIKAMHNDTTALN